MKPLYTQFNEITKMKLFEIEIEGEFYLYNIEANQTGLFCTSYNSGLLVIEWDECFSLDENLCALHDLCLDDAQKQYIEDEGV